MTEGYGRDSAHLSRPMPRHLPAALDAVYKRGSSCIPPVIAISIVGARDELQVVHRGSAAQRVHGRVLHQQHGVLYGLPNLALPANVLQEQLLVPPSVVVRRQPGGRGRRRCELGLEEVEHLARNSWSSHAQRNESASERC